MTVQYYALLLIALMGVSETPMPDGIVPHVTYILLAVVEFFLINWMGRLSISSGYYQISFVQRVEDAPLFNTVFRILAPTVFLVLTAAAWYGLGFEGSLQAYWLVTAYYFALRWVYNVVMERHALLNWPKQVLTAGMGTGLSYFAAQRVLTSREILLPSGRGLTDQLWIVIIGFVYLTATRVNWPLVGSSAEERRASYIRRQYARFKKSFGGVIASAAASTAAETLAYSILIYESFNRPRIYQAIEKRALFPIGLARSLGPMQVQTTIRLDDSNLVRLGVERVNAAFDKVLASYRADSTVDLSPPRGTAQPDDTAALPTAFASLDTWYQDDLVRRAAAQYNVRSDYPAEVAGIFSFLRAEYYAELDPAVRRAQREATVVTGAR